MIANTQPFAIRTARERDTSALCDLLNEIIRIGGTTAVENPLSDREFSDWFLKGANHVSCLVAENKAGATLGFQALEHHPKLPDDWADIATYARVEPRIPGVGTALFIETVALAKNIGLSAINATIRADNASGLAYYAKMGFQSYSVKRGVPLRSGTPIDRISKRFLIG